MWTSRWSSVFFLACLVVTKASVAVLNCTKHLQNSLDGLVNFVVPKATNQHVHRDECRVQSLAASRLRGAKSQVAGLRVQVWGSGFRVSGSGFRVSNFGTLVSSFEFIFFRFRVSGCGFRILGFGIGVSCRARSCVSSMLPVLSFRYLRAGAVSCERGTPCRPKLQDRELSRRNVIPSRVSSILPTLSFRYLRGVR